jgi:hypothetical protein
MPSPTYHFLYQLNKARKLGYPFISSVFEFPKYLSFLRSEKTNLELELPWITFRSLNFLDKIDLEEKNVFEFGSGGSTLYFLSRGSNVISIEHDTDWYLLVNEKLKEYHRIDFKLIQPEFDSLSKIVSIQDKKFAGYSFKNYANSILDYPDNHFDLVVIDGRARPFCLMNSIRKVKKGGYILFDNSNRQHYLEELDKIEDWLIFKSYGPTVNDKSFNQTSIYRVQ